MHSLHLSDFDKSPSYLPNCLSPPSSSSRQDGAQLNPNYKATLYYNLACCYQRLGMLEECVDYLELATKALKANIIALENQESALLLNNNSNSLEGD